MPAPDATWVDNADDLQRLVDALSAVDRYGIDTEFHREKTYWPQLALVQIAWDGGLALVDPIAVDITPMAAIFDDARTAIFHAADQDIEILSNVCGAIPAKVFDTQIAAGFLGWSTPSLSTLANDLLDVHLAKGDRMTDWTVRPLSAGQQKYAAADVAHLLELHSELTSRLEACGRLDWAWEECQTQFSIPRPPQDPATAWWRLKDNRSLRGPARGIAQEVTAWRERRAAELDRPIRMVLPDLAIVGIANRPPKDDKALRAIRGLDGRHLGGGGVTAILEAVKRGQALPADQVHVAPTDDLDRRLRPAVTLVSAWISQLARDLRLDPAILATRGDLVGFLQGSDTARLASGWRHDLVGDPVRRVVAGEAAIAFKPGSGDLELEHRSGQPILVDLPLPDPASTRR
ncbi:MAG: ribonuclease D [Acidimicrobiales bacterium]